MSDEWFLEQTGRQEVGENSYFLQQLEDGVALEHIGVPHEALDAAEGNNEIIGSPETDMEHWHLQTEPNSCAIACQEFVAEQLLDQDLSEEKMISFAAERGWYGSESGTSISDMGRLLEAMGLRVEAGMGCTIEDIVQEIETDGKVICGVNSMVMQSSAFASIPGIKADHAVQLIGFDLTDAKQAYAILNDPGVENGQGLRVPMETFSKAWATSGNYAAIARKEAV